MKSHLPNRSSFTVIAILLSAISTQVSAGVFFQGTGNPDQDPNLQGGTVINFDAGPPDTSGEVSFDGVTFIGDDATTVDVVETVTVGDALIGTLNTRGTYSLYNGPEASSTRKFRFDFATQVEAFGFNWGASDPGKWVLTVFDSGGSEISLTTPPPGGFVPGTGNSNQGNYVGITANGIAYATLENQGSVDWVFIDNFTFVSTATPEEQIANLMEAVVKLNLKQGISNALDSKLDNVLKALEDANANNDVSAINTLYAFMYSVEAQRAIHITDEQADMLTAEAQAIIDLLSSN